jgi:pimeloyl-ACP methyl ester carboxylesterase
MHGLAMVMLAAVTACPGSASRPGGRDPARSSEAEIRSGTATLHLWSRGGGAGDDDVLVLVNGGPGLSHESMDPLQAALASPRLQVVTYDQRGVGRSRAAGSGPFTVDDYLDDVDAIRRYLHRGRIHLLGHSFGGMIALSYLDRHPDRVTSLVLVSTGVSDPVAMNAGGQAFGQHVAALQRDGVIPNQLPAGCRERFLALLPAYFGDPHFAVPQEMQRRQCDSSDRSDVLDAWIHTPYEGGVRTSTISVLILRGELEPFGPVPSQAAAAVLERARVRLVELPRCGHIGWLECPATFLAHVQSFLRTLPRSPP